MTPIISRAPVPELPKSSGPSGPTSPPTPRPRTTHSSSCLLAGAPSELTALAVPSTSAASRSPLMRVMPLASAPNSNALWEMDLSPGTQTIPLREFARPAHNVAVATFEEDGWTCSFRLWSLEERSGMNSLLGLSNWIDEGWSRRIAVSGFAPPV